MTPIPPDPLDTQTRLQQSVWRITAKSPDRVGYWLARHLTTEQLVISTLAEKLGTSESGLSQLALCLNPNPETFAEDVLAIASHCGVNPTALANLLRQEQTLAVWAAPPTPAEPSSSAGWLLAAHDADQPPPGDDDDDPDRD